MIHREVQQPIPRSIPSIVSMIPTPEPLSQSDVAVKLLLTGGHEYVVVLKVTDPLLHRLIATLSNPAPESAQSQNLLQIPLDQGRSSLCFPKHHLVGLVTEPAISIQPRQHQSPCPLAVSPTKILLSNYLLVENFLTPEEHQRLLGYVMQREGSFVSTCTSTDDPGYRQSKILYEFSEFSELIVERIQGVFPDVLTGLGQPWFAASTIEVQLTCHGDGNYYRIHNDNGSPETVRRELSYVYYFHRDPKPFSGGELVIYDSKVEQGHYVAADSCVTIEPRDNSIIFFLSRYLHEVLPVCCPSQAFADSRFTLNGWISRAQ